MSCRSFDHFADGPFVILNSTCHGWRGLEFTMNPHKLCSGETLPKFLTTEHIETRQSAIHAKPRAEPRKPALFGVRPAD